MLLSGLQHKTFLGGSLVCLLFALLLLCDSVDGTLILHRIVNATQRGAVCMDGSPGAFYVHRNTSSTHWVIHLQGGGFCRSFAECQDRVNNDPLFASSKQWLCALPHPLLTTPLDAARTATSDGVRNPEFLHWNRVYLRYCTGDVYLGRATVDSTGMPQKNPFQVFSAGRNVVIAMIEDLLQHHGMDEASFVLFGGSSAGGLGVMAHLDDVADMVRDQSRSSSQVKVAGYLDGWARLHPTLREWIANPLASLYQSQFLGLLNQLRAFVWNSYVPPRCFQAYTNVPGGWRGMECFDPQFGARFLQAPIMIMAARWDTYQMFAYFDKTPYSCAATTRQLDAEERNFTSHFGIWSNQLAHQLTQYDTVNIYFTNCYTHTFIGTDQLCDGVNGTDAYLALAEFARRYDSDPTSYRRVRIIESPPLDEEQLTCNSRCGSVHCDWALNITRHASACANMTVRIWEHFRFGNLCDGAMHRQYARTHVASSEMVRYDVVNAKNRSATCMDGTPATYYVQRNYDSTQWIIFFQGGSLCTGVQECATVFLPSSLGSSANHGCTLSSSIGRSVIDSDPVRNPKYHSWNKVFVRYCTGDLFLGTAKSVGGMLSLTGHYIVNEVFEDLLDYHDLGAATDLLVGGVSAGAVGAMHHLDDIADMVRTRAGGQVVRVRGYSDGGWFRLAPSLSDYLSNRQLFESPQIYASPHVTGFISVFTLLYQAYYHQGCAAGQRTHPLGKASCFTFDVLWPYLQTPAYSISPRWTPSISI